MELSPALVKAIYRRVFRVTAQVRTARRAVCGAPAGWTGTAFCFAIWQESRRPIVATARHILDFPPGTRVHLRFERFDDEDQPDGVATIEVESDSASRPFGFYKLSDIGFVHLPAMDDAGKALFHTGENPLPVIPWHRRLTAGSWVAWAGFPGQVEDLLAHAQLCFFQGSVSAFGRRLDPSGHAYYIVDGHAAQGVSGGPVWEYGAEGTLEVAGIVSEFHGEPARGDAPVIPGFCCVEPINPLIAYASTNFQGK